LLCTARTATLRVYANPGVLARVEFGGAVATRPGERDVWSLEIPVPEGCALLRVVGVSGEEFAMDLQLVAVDDTGG
jgi:hypothetical protein